MMTPQRIRAGIAFLGLGALAIGAQVLFVREMLVPFFGNELIIGALLSAWLTGIALGALAARCGVERITCPRIAQWTLFVLALILTISLPFQLIALRAIRGFLRIPPGEYAPFGVSVLSAFALLLPTTAVVGAAFPVGCRWLWLADPARRSPVSVLYALESLGSLVGGWAMSFLLLPRFPVSSILTLLVATGLATAVTLAPKRFPAWMGGGLAFVVAVAGVMRGPVLQAWQERLDQLRWRSFGLLRSTHDDRPRTRLVQAADSIYQNLAILETEGQYALYGNGQVLFVFPDALGDETSIHFVMAQKPDARRILMLGGNPVGEVRELLKYPLTRLVHVDLDPTVRALVRSILPADNQRAPEDVRATFVAGDPFAFVRDCPERFDVILARTPEPTTAGASRFYTVEFYRQLKALLAEGGHVVTAVTTSERLQGEAISLGATVYRTLCEVFPVVLVTAEGTHRFFAGTCAARPEDPESDGLTFDRDLLADRFRRAGIATEYFQPEYFLGADHIRPEKTERVKALFMESRAPVNTRLQPVAYYYNLLLWTRMGSPRLHAFLRRAGGQRLSAPSGFFVAGGLFALGVASFLCRYRRRFPTACARFARRSMALVILSTGFCGMALEVLLLYIFQNLHGYLYTRMGAIVAAFMFGLMVGAPSGRFFCRCSLAGRCLGLAGGELLLLILAQAGPFCIRLADEAGGAWLSRSEWMIFAAVMLAGWAVGAEFSLANRLFTDAGGSVSVGAAVTDAADHMGAAFGSLFFGVLCVPVWGVEACAHLLAAMKVAGILLVLSAGWCLASSRGLGPGAFVPTALGSPSANPG